MYSKVNPNTVDPPEIFIKSEIAVPISNKNAVLQETTVEKVVQPKFIDLTGTELDDRDYSVEIIETALPEKPSTSTKQSKLNLTVDGTISTNIDGTTTKITQLVKNSYVSFKKEQAPIKIGGTNKTIQYNKDGTFEGSNNLVWNYDEINLDITGNLSVANSIITNSIQSNNSLNINNQTFVLTSNNIILTNYTLPNTDGIKGQIFSSDEFGNVTWSSPESTYQDIIVLTNAMGIVNHNFGLGSLFVHDSIAGDFTINLINFNMESEKSTNIVVQLNQGPVAFYINGFRINGITIPIKWVNSSPQFGTALQSDIVSFTIIRIATTYFVLAQMISFG